MANREFDKIQSQHAALKTERSPWMAHCREVRDYLLPYAGTFETTERHRGERRGQQIIDETATQDHETLIAGLMSSRTNPARPWFKMAATDRELDKNHDARKWLDEVTWLMHRAMNRSNSYRSIARLYGDNSAFGTACSIMLPDPKRVVHHYLSPIGEYCLAQNYQGDVNTVYREFEKTVGEVVPEFGLEKCSKQTRRAWDRGEYQTRVKILHVIEPREQRDPTKRDAVNMPFSSCYYEVGKAKGEGQILRESGFREFPAVTPRWDVWGHNVYGVSPGMKALGSIRQLQHQNVRLSEVLNHMTDPALQVPVALANQEVDSLPGGRNYVDQSSPSNGIRPLNPQQPRIDYFIANMEDVRDRIHKSLHADLFRMFSSAAPNRDFTAAEIYERRDEKYAVLGPVSGRLQNEQDEPIVNLLFTTMLRGGAFPPPPQVMLGADLDVEFIGPLPQALKRAGLGDIDRLVAHIGQVAQLKPEVLHKYDADEGIDAYSDMLGVDPDLIVAGDKVALIRKAEGERAAAMEQAELMAQGAAATRDLASADTSGQNALTDAAAASA